LDLINIDITKTIFDGLNEIIINGKIYNKWKERFGR
jgi:hypothetical protein